MKNHNNYNPGNPKKTTKGNVAFYLFIAGALIAGVLDERSNNVDIDLREKEFALWIKEQSF